MKWEQHYLQAAKRCWRYHKECGISFGGWYKCMGLAGEAFWEKMFGPREGNMGQEVAAQYIVETLEDEELFFALFKRFSDTWVELVGGNGKPTRRNRKPTEKCVLNGGGYCEIKDERCHPKDGCVLLVCAYMRGKIGESVGETAEEYSRIHAPRIEEMERVKRIIAREREKEG